MKKNSHSLTQKVLWGKIIMKDILLFVSIFVFLYVTFNYYSKIQNTFIFSLRHQIESSSYISSICELQLFLAFLVVKYLFVFSWIIFYFCFTSTVIANRILELFYKNSWRKKILITIGHIACRVIYSTILQLINY